jgi:2'-5' RNA ligase
MRLFTAITLAEPARARLGQVLRELKPRLLKGRLTPVENLHLTLVFIGETREGAAAKRALDEVTAPPFLLTLEGLGRFRRSGGDLLWLGGGGEHLESIYDQLRLALSRGGFSLEKRPFKAHLTLGRDLAFAPDFSWEDYGRALPPLTVPVDKVSLMQSERIEGRLRYTEIHRRPLLAKEV